ncbi:MAG: type I methionyl aminopeptidase [Candidatus Omnitrophica bacterium]|jgi:methionyl aminopeptidase|nr:type I methionyl aminopeptidase [Candidatus Omnitrophota bacterium]
MITLRSRAEAEKIEAACRIVADTLEYLGANIKQGVTTKDLDDMAARYIKERGAVSAFKGYMGFPANICTSVNETVVHGIPGKLVLKEGDIIGLDVGVKLNGYFGDAAMSFPVGRVSEEAEKLLRVAEESLYKGIENARPEKRLYDISSAVQEHAESNGFSVVREFVGHGIGTKMHEDPQIPNFGVPGTGVRLKAGMVLAIEPMVNAGRYGIKILDDGWTAVTTDRKLSAHFEHTVYIGENGPEILTKWRKKRQ